LGLAGVGITGTENVENGGWHPTAGCCHHLLVIRRGPYVAFANELLFEQ